VGELSEVLKAIERLDREGRPMALATIVATRGSTYRRPGARLLVAEDGRWVGDIAGGCLEAQVVDVARAVLAGGGPRLVGFDLTADDEAVWGFGLGCNGAIEVFVEPVARAGEVATALRRALEEERPVCLVTALSSSVPGVEPGARLVVHPGGEREGSLGSAAADEVATAEALRALSEGRSATRRFEVAGGDLRAFVEVLEPPVRLLVCGAGHDAIPLVRFAAALGLKPLVVDDRPAFLTRDRFPEAAAFVPVERPEQAAEAAGVDPRTAAVVMTHNYLRDLGYLRSFLGTPLFYLGCMGPRARFQQLLADLEREGVRPTPRDREVLHGPAGIDLGAEGPEEIAWAILAEILAVRRRRGAGFLRDRGGPIHDRAPADAGAL
jgi:xanthine dehydrogenase accessory factor